MMSTADMHLSPKGRNFTWAFEGVALRAYKDVVGVVTIGAGITNADPIYKELFGHELRMGDTINLEQAATLFDRSMAEKYEPSVRRALPPDSNQGTFDMGCDFHYNTGAIERATWPKALAKGDKGLAKQSLLSWNKAGGNVVKGLTRRRVAEWNCIENGDYGPEGNQSPPIVKTNADGKEVGVEVAKGPGMLRKGDKGPDVKLVREMLVDLGFLPRLESDEFDDTMDAAVRKFQASHPDLTLDGVIGPATRNQLMREDAAWKKAKSSTTKTVATATVSAGIAWGAIGKGAAVLVGSAVGVLGLCVLVYLGITYRTEIVSAFNRAIGRQVA